MHSAVDFENIDLLVVGAGPVGCVVAERAAAELGWRVLVVEKRPHVAGNCHDSISENGVMVHDYGPHYFRTDNPEIIRYLSNFTTWLPGRYIVKSMVRGKLHPFPINLDTLEQFFGRSFTGESAAAYLESLREPDDNPSNSEAFVLSRVGRAIYEAFYLGYTVKQWERHPRELDPSVCGRVPIRFNRDPRYMNQRYQMMPALGYTAMFSAMLRNPLIQVALNTDYREVQAAVRPNFATVYSGPIDAYFDYKLGRLPWRSLRFDHVPYQEEYHQPCVQINYPNDHAYTRSVEIKHITRQKLPSTMVSYEYPSAFGDPYYPIPEPATDALYQRYKSLADQETIRKRVFFVGRLAQYQYINTDQAIEYALNTAESLKRLAYELPLDRTACL